MRYLVLTIFLFLSASADTQSINKKWETNKNCEGCHSDISSTWETSRHSNSHFSKNDLYKKTLQYMVAQKPTLILDEVKVDCAKCHNPRLVKKKMSDEDKILLAMGNEDVTDSYNEALNAAAVKNGINCIVCHNVDEIHLDKAKGSEGTHSIKFGPQGTMFGPFHDAVSPFHKTEQRDHYTQDSPDLCFACHYAAKNSHGLEVYSTGREYDMTRSIFTNEPEGCKTCHMSEKHSGVASNYSAEGDSPKARMVRKHRFTSVDNSNILSRFTEVSGKASDGSVDITIKNNSPHKIPTGFGLREIVIEVSFLDIKDKVIETRQQKLTTTWKDDSGKETVPYLATSMGVDTRLDPKTSRTYKFSTPVGTKFAKYTVYYKLVGDKLAKEMGVSDQFFLKKYTSFEGIVVLDLVQDGAKTTKAK